MDVATIRAFADEMKKIAKTLTKSEEREQVAKFTGLGAAAMPAAVGAGNLMMGKGITGGTRMKRWMPAQVVVGGIMGGGVPAFRHRIERGMQEKAKDRREAERARTTGS